jgi:hypothetical protein
MAVDGVSARFAGRRMSSDSEPARREPPLEGLERFDAGVKFPVSTLGMLNLISASATGS